MTILELQTPLTTLEMAELLLEAAQRHDMTLTPQAVDLLRRLMFEVEQRRTL